MYSLNVHDQIITFTKEDFDLLTSGCDTIRTLVLYCCDKKEHITEIPLCGTGVTTFGVNNVLFYLKYKSLPNDIYCISKLEPIRIAADYLGCEILRLHILNFVCNELKKTCITSMIRYTMANRQILIKS